ncbi:MAG TPA: MarR family transcriptional regulator [Coleofasciculaceae cyanobacterium]
MLTTPITSEQCAIKVMEVVPKVMRFMRAEARQQQQPFLSLSQLRVLGFLERCPEASLSEVADYFDVSRSSMSAMIERLVQRRLVNRIEDPKERRRVNLTLTTTGTEYLHQVYEVIRSQLADALANLSDAQLRQVMEGIALLGEAFKDFKAP